MCSSDLINVTNKYTGLDIRYVNTLVINNSIINITNNNYEGIYLFYTSSYLVTIQNSEIIGGNYGIYYDRGYKIKIINTKTTNGRLKSNSYYFILPSSVYCGVLFDNFTSSFGDGTYKKNMAYNTTVTIDGWNNNFSSIFLCNADNS